MDSISSAPVQATANYKALKEAFVSNLNGGSISEINAVTCVLPVSLPRPHCLCPHFRIPLIYDYDHMLHLTNYFLNLFFSVRDISLVSASVPQKLLPAIHHSGRPDRLAHHLCLSPFRPYNLLLAPHPPQPLSARTRTYAPLVLRKSTGRHAKCKATRQQNPSWIHFLRQNQA